MKLQVSALPNDSHADSYHVLIACVGYEERSRFVAERLSGQVEHVWAFDYGATGLHSYGENLEYYTPFEVEGVNVDLHRSRIVRLIDELRSSLPEEPETGEAVLPRIAVDISSMDRDLLAQTVLACTQDQEAPLQVDFFYSDGEFSADLVGSSGAVLVNRPMLGLEGWPSDADAPVVCVVGLGFEDKLATAVIETIEPRQTIALIPVGDDERYDDVVLQRNSLLLASDVLDAKHQYSVIDVLQTVVDLNASVSSWARKSRVVIAPLGPKTFALAAALVSIANGQNVTVWRMSADNGRSAEQRRASGTVTGLRVRVNGADR